MSQESNQSSDRQCCFQKPYLPKDDPLQRSERGGGPQPIGEGTGLFHHERIVKQEQRLVP